MGVLLDLLNKLLSIILKWFSNKEEKAKADHLEWEKGLKERLNKANKEDNRIDFDDIFGDKKR